MNVTKPFENVIPPLSLICSDVLNEFLTCLSREPFRQQTEEKPKPAKM